MRVLCVWTLTCVAMVFMAGVFSGCWQSSTVTTSSLSEEDLADLPIEQQVIVAASKGDLDSLKALVESDPELVYVLGEENRTPLHYAAAYGHNDIVEYLLDNGADPLFEDTDGVCPQSTATQRGHPDTAKIIASAIESAGLRNAQQ